MCLKRKKKGKSKALSRVFRLFDSETVQRALQLLHIYCLDVHSHFSALESNTRFFYKKLVYKKLVLRWPKF